MAYNLDVARILFEVENIPVKMYLKNISERLYLKIVAARYT